jgi:acetylornithine deacetylase
MSVTSFEFNEPRYLGLLKNLIGETKFLQNSPAQGLIPQEDLAIKHIMEVLGPHSKRTGESSRSRRLRSLRTEAI